MNCWTIAAWARDGYLALLLVSLPSTAQVLHLYQYLCSKETEGEKEDRTERTTSCDVGSCEKLTKEEAEDACARLYIGISLFVINEVNEDSTEEEDNDKINQTDNETENDNVEASIGGGGFSIPSPNNCKSCIEF